MLDGAMAYTMTGRIETAMSCTTTLMADFTFIKAVSTVFIITFRKTSKDITRSDIASITNNHAKSPNQHSGHPGYPPREEGWRE